MENCLKCQLLNQQMVINRVTSKGFQLDYIVARERERERERERVENS